MSSRSMFLLFFFVVIHSFAFAQSSGQESESGGQPAVSSINGSRASDQASVEEVRFKSGEVELAGALYLPPGRGPHPAIVVTHGSGREGRQLLTYRTLAELLVKEQTAVLIFDKRGVGDSPGVYIETPDLRVPAGDVVSAAAFLKARKEIDAKRIGVFGHSQGGWVGPLAATLSKDLAFVISLCGPGVSNREQVLYQRGVELKAQGNSSEVVETIIGFGRKLYTYLGTGEGYEKLKPEYEQAVTQPWFAFFKNSGFGDQLPAPETLNKPVFNFFRNIRYDPFPVLKNVSVPTLALFGENDKQIPTAESAKLWQLAFSQSGNQQLTLKVLPHEGHEIWWRAGSGLELRAAFREPLLEWLRQQLKTRVDKSSDKL